MRGREGAAGRRTAQRAHVWTLHRGLPDLCVIGAKVDREVRGGAAGLEENHLVPAFGQPLRRHVERELRSDAPVSLQVVPVDERLPLPPAKQREEAVPELARRDHPAAAVEPRGAIGQGCTRSVPPHRRSGRERRHVLEAERRDAPVGEGLPVRRDPSIDAPETAVGVHNPPGDAPKVLNQNVQRPARCAGGPHRRSSRLGAGEAVGIGGERRLQPTHKQEARAAAGVVGAGVHLERRAGWGRRALCGAPRGRPVLVIVRAVVARVEVRPEAPGVRRPPRRAHGRDVGGRALHRVHAGRAALAELLQLPVDEDVGPVAHPAHRDRGRRPRRDGRAVQRVAVPKPELFKRPHRRRRDRMRGQHGEGVPDRELLGEHDRAKRNDGRRRRQRGRDVGAVGLQHFLQREEQRPGNARLADR
eukprot:m.322378 g.322378  ORF g.322378 m.322378 type:complete len:417 (+) comp27604_c0_seq4:79-1329(+)